MKIQIMKYASGDFNTPTLPGQMFKSKEDLIKAVKLADQKEIGRPMFNGVSPDSLEQMYLPVKTAVSTLVKDLSRHINPQTQPKAHAALQQWITALQTTKPLYDNFSKALQSEYGAIPNRPWERKVPNQQPNPNQQQPNPNQQQPPVPR
jgi:hypothetical protein